MGIVLQIHTIWQWVILVLAGLVALKALIGWLGKQRYTSLDDRLAMVLTILLDIQFLIGLILWLFGPRSIASLPDSMGNPLLRFYLLEHNIIFLIALVLAHLGRSRARKAEGDVNKHKRSFVFFLVAFLFILLIFIMRSMLG